MVAAVDEQVAAESDVAVAVEATAVSTTATASVVFLWLGHSAGE